MLEVTADDIVGRNVCLCVVVELGRRNWKVGNLV